MPDVGPPGAHEVQRGPRRIHGCFSHEDREAGEETASALWARGKTFKKPCSKVRFEDPWNPEPDLTAIEGRAALYKPILVKVLTLGMPREAEGFHKQSHRYPFGLEYVLPH